MAKHLHFGLVCPKDFFPEVLIKYSNQVFYTPANKFIFYLYNGSKIDWQ